MGEGYVMGVCGKKRFFKNLSKRIISFSAGLHETYTSDIMTFFFVCVQFHLLGKTVGDVLFVLMSPW